MDNRIRLEIVEQPQQRGMRFRYECEGRSAGSIPGENTTADKKTWPACQIVNYSGHAVVRVSLVSKDNPPRPHPHSLVGRDCDKGVCQTNLDPSNQMLATFPNLGIQCVRRREVNGAIMERIRNNVNPFGTVPEGDERSSVDVDLNIVRLCFEAFLPDRNGHYTVKLDPVVSNPIYDKKATCAGILKICRVDKTHGSARGQDEVFLLCDKVQKEDIQVVFTKGKWEALADFSSVDVHRQVAIVFRTPPYQDPNIQESVEVEFKLRRPSDKQVSKSLQFTYLPMQQEGKHKTFSIPNPSSSNDGRNQQLRRAIEAKCQHSQNFRYHRNPQPRPKAQAVRTAPPPRWNPQPPPFQEVKQEPAFVPANMPSWQTPFPQTFMPTPPMQPTTMFESSPLTAELSFASQSDIPGTSGQLMGTNSQLMGNLEPPSTFVPFNGDPLQEKFPSVGVEMTSKILAEESTQDHGTNENMKLEDLINIENLSLDFDGDTQTNMSITDNVLAPSMTVPKPLPDYRPQTMPGNYTAMSPPQQMLSPQQPPPTPQQHQNLMSPPHSNLMSPHQALTPLQHPPQSSIGQAPMLDGFNMGYGHYHTNNNNNLFTYDAQQEQRPDDMIANFLKTIEQ